MPRPNILDRLNEGQTLLLDGGTGSELQRRGVDVLLGATDGLKAWSATANIEFADVVQQVHQDYLRVGADIITSNNFWTGPTRLERCGLGGEWRRYARAAAENALKARDKLNAEAYVAGGIAAPTLQGPPESGPASDTRQMGRAACFREWAEHARLLVEMGVDLIQAEYVGFIEDCLTACRRLFPDRRHGLSGRSAYPTGRNHAIRRALGRLWSRLWRDAPWGRSC